MSSCPWRLAWRNPLGDEDIHIACQLPAHLPAEPTHEGLHANGVTAVKWIQGDRRGFQGEFAGWCSEPGCVLPRGHLGRCAK